jgi:hypothetical protein
MYMNNVFEIIKLNYKNKEHLNAIAAIHSSVLPESNVPRIGPLFMKRFYYTTLVKKGIIKCFLASYNGKIVGILVSTTKPYSWMRMGMQGERLNLGFILMASVLQKPARLIYILKQLKFKLDPSFKEYEESKNTFEILTTGVLKEYRKVAIGDTSKTALFSFNSIAHKLVDHVLSMYAANGFKYAIGQIIKSNKASQLFFSTYRAEFINSTVRSDSIIMKIDIDH